MQKPIGGRSKLEPYPTEPKPNMPQPRPEKSKPQRHAKKPQTTETIAKKQDKNNLKTANH